MEGRVTLKDIMEQFICEIADKHNIGIYEVKQEANGLIFVV